jgi:hypothetical protein
MSPVAPQYTQLSVVFRLRLRVLLALRDAISSHQLFFDVWKRTTGSFSLLPSLLPKLSSTATI